MQDYIEDRIQFNGRRERLAELRAWASNGRFDGAVVVQDLLDLTIALLMSRQN